jgi:hypothetical protein
VRALLLCVGLLILAACEPAAPVARYTVEQYRSDAQLRAATLDRCANDPGTLRDSPDCLNAQRAASLEGRGSLRSSGPVGLKTDPQ